MDDTTEDPSSDDVLDMYCGDGHGILGRSAPDVVQAITAQAAIQLAASSQPSELERELCERLSAATFGTTAALTVCGDLAVEWAIAAARIHGGEKFKVITFVGDQHGCTLACRAAGGDPQQQRDLGPLVAGFVHCPTADAAAVSEAIDATTVAILVQPLQTHNGLRALPPGFLAELRQLADENQLLLIVDETQLAIGSSGRLCCHAGDEGVPDALILSAGLASGLPIGAVILSDALATELDQHPLLNADRISPVVAAAALATLGTIEDEDLLTQVQTKSAQLAARLEPLRDDFEFVRDIRCFGLLIALELDLEAADVQAQLQSRGIRVGTAGTHTLRLQPACTITEQQLQHFVEALTDVFQRLEREPMVH